MRSKIWLILAGILICGISIPAFSAVEKVKVGGDLTIYGVYRHNFDFIKDSYYDPWWGEYYKDNQHFFQTTARVYVSADLTDNVSAMIRLINERDWGKEVNSMYSGANNTDVNLDLAYIKVKDIMTPGLTLTVGRQEIQIGEGLVVGSAYSAADYMIGTGNLPYLVAPDLGLQKAFDAIKIDYESSVLPLTLSGFMAKIYESFGGVVAPGETGDVTLYGASLLWKPENFTVEPYYVGEITAFEDKGNEFDLSTVGIRVTCNVPAVEGLSLKGEYAKQFGDADGLGLPGADFKGFAGLLGVSYLIPADMSPDVSLNYNYFSGEKWTDKDVKVWYPVAPSNVADRVGKIAYASLFPYGEGIGLLPAGLQVVNLGFALKPLDKLTLNLDWYNLRCVKAYSPGLKKAIGNEIDFGLTYNYTEDLAFGLDIGYLMKGKYIKQMAPPGYAASPFQAIASMKVAF